MSGHGSTSGEAFASSAGPISRSATSYVSPGTTDVPGILAHLPRADVVIAGEPREWEAVPYIADNVTAGHSKGMIALGRLVSEEPGTLVAAVWLKSVMPELTIESIRLTDPYWSPRV